MTQSIDDAVSERYEGNYVDAAELMACRGVKVLIESVIAPNTEKDARKKLIDKPLLVLKGGTKNKKLIVGKTNWKILVAMFGKKSSGWIGKEITIAARYLPKSQGFGQVNCPCVRIIPPHGHPIPKSAMDFMGTAQPVGSDGGGE
jgi:hypothetical protein